MSFTRANPPGWPVGSIFTSAQANQLDADHAISLDKSVAGDQLSGLITFTGGQIQANQASAIAAKIAQGFSVDIAAGLTTTAAGAINLNGGGTDEVQYQTPRTVVLAWPGIPLGGLTTGWTVGTTYGTLQGPGNTHAGQTIAVGPIPMHHGATWTNVRVFVTVGTHSALPGTMPKCEVHKYNLTTATDTTVASVFASPGSFAAWNATTFWDVAVPNLVIDRTQYYYYLVLADEFGTNSVADQYNGFELTQGSISNAGFAL